MSGEELIEKMCWNCRHFDDYDGCMKRNLVYYNEEEESIECEEYKEVQDAEDLYWEEYNVKERVYGSKGVKEWN